MKNPSLTTPLRLGSRLLPLALGAAALLSLSAAASAQRLYWDTNPAAAGLGGTGNWNINPGGTANWAPNAAGVGPNIVWPNTAATDAVFSGTAGTVTVSVPGVQVRDIDFLTTGYVINGASNLTLAPGAVISMVGGFGTATAIISVNLDASGLTKTGVGDNVLDLRGSDVFAGDVKVLEGQVKLSLGGKIKAQGFLVDTGVFTDPEPSVVVDGPTSKWLNIQPAVIADQGLGSLTLRNGGQFEDTGADVGKGLGSVGSVTVTNAGSTWTTGFLTVGTRGTGSLLVSDDGDVVAGGAIIGDRTGSLGHATVTGGGSTWTNSGGLTVGNNGTGTLLIANTGKVTSTDGLLGKNAGNGIATINGTASKWTITGDLKVGAGGTGTLRIENDGDVISQRGFIGEGIGSEGIATVTGVGSTWVMSNYLTVGLRGFATLRVEAAGQVGALVTAIGAEAGGVGNVTVTGLNSLLANTATLLVGDSG